MSLLFGLGAFIGTVADQIHVRAGVLSYAHPTSLLPGQAFWVPFLFGSAGFVLVFGHAVLLRLSREPVPVPSVSGFATSVIWFFAAYASTALLQDAPLRLTLALGWAWAVRVAFSATRDKTMAGPLYAVAGSLFESALSSTGLFRYEHPDLLLVPAWLPALYLHVSLMTRQVYVTLFAGEVGAKPRG